MKLPLVHFPTPRRLRVHLFCWWICLSAAAFAQNETFSVTAVGDQPLFDAAWDLEYGPDDHLWVTERKLGQVLRIDPETGERDVLLTIPDLFTDSGQNGLLGMALHPGLPADAPYVYLSYTYQRGAERRQRLVRYTYLVSADGADGTLADPLTLLEALPASNDHNSGRLVYGPDGKLYYTIGDQGGNQNRNYCLPVLSQVLPTQAEVDAGDWSAYPGKTLRLDVDGGIPADNPVLAGVRSHVWTYGHRNAQGIAFGPGGRLFSSEHGPDTDDEVNLLRAGGNYGWPRVVGFRDDQAYDYCNWSSLEDCAARDYDKFNCPGGAEFLEESSLVDTSYVDPLYALFAVPDDYDFEGPGCADNWVCRPNVAPSSIAYYGSEAIPSWTNSLLVVSLKRGRIYRLQLDESGAAVAGDTLHYFYTRNRLRDLVVAPNGTDFYAITDRSGGRVTDRAGLNAFREFANPGALLRFSFAGLVSTDAPAPERNFRVWPNPADGEIYLSGPAVDGVREATVELIDAGGRTVTRRRYRSAGITLSVGGRPAGTYFVRIISDGATETHRVVVSRR